jgi:hypothetical protein
MNAVRVIVTLIIPMSISQQTSEQSTILPLPPLLSQRGDLPRTLVFGSVGDRGQAVTSWFGTETQPRHYDIALVYYGKEPHGNWARQLKRSVNYFDVHRAGKFQNLAWWLERHPRLLNAFDYFIIADDDIVMTPDGVERAIRTTREFHLPVAGSSHSWSGKNDWHHMGSRGAGPRMNERGQGVEFCNFVEMTCPIFEAAALQQFLDYFKPYRDLLTGWGTDYLMSNACFTEQRPFGVLHNVQIQNPHSRCGLKTGQREIDLLQSTKDRERAWLNLNARYRFAISSKRDIRTWLSTPRMRCINLARATERRQQFTNEWINRLGFSISYFDAIDRRQIDSKLAYFRHDAALARSKFGRPLTSGEVACATSHALVLREEQEFCGPEGVFIFEDDCMPLLGAELIIPRVQSAVAALPGVEVVGCHRPYRYDQVTQYEAAGAALRVKHPPWGANATWYSPSGLQQALKLLTGMQVPADAIWRDFARERKYALLDPPVAHHDDSTTTYIGNEYRGIQRCFVP